jgi:hypothetical protein
MMQVDVNATPKPRPEKIGRHDWIVLPLLSVGTMVVLLAGMELVARRVYYESAPFIATCLGPLDSSGGGWAPPNSVCHEKKFETSNIEYKFNSCGHRAGMECGPKPEGVYRIVMGGSSFAMGHLVAREETFAALLPAELSRQTGRRVELYNEGLVTVEPRGPHDILDEVPEPVRPAAPPQSGLTAKVHFLLKSTFSNKPLSVALRDLSDHVVSVFEESASARMLHHFLYKSRSEYLKSSLMKDDGTGYLKAQPSPKWQSRLAAFDEDEAAVAAKAKAAGVPLVVVLVPNRIEAAMISDGTWQGDYDPYKLDRELQTIVERHGGIYVDIHPRVGKVANFDEGYFAMDGHPNAKGNWTIARMLTQELMSKALPGLTTQAATTAAVETPR